MALKQHEAAADHFYNVLEKSPFRYCPEKQPAISSEEQKEESKKESQPLKFNSISCYAHAWSNLAVIFLLMSTEGHSTVDVKNFNRESVEKKALDSAKVCIQKAIEAMPVGEGSEAYINMNNVMRQLGCDKQAHEMTWM